MERQASVLIVDDEPGMTETMSAILGHLGYDVEVAGNGFEAIERVKTRPFDVVLMDIRMPGINGVETCKEIKSLRPDTAVMMMTAYSVEELVAEALERGAHGIMHKPLDIRRALEFIERVKESALVLIVDDDISTCRTLVDVLEEKGYRVGRASSGEEALALVREREFDIVFIEIKMPVMNGLEVYLSMRELRPNVKAVMMTGYRAEVEEIVDEALRNGVYTCLYKPFDLVKVLSIVEGILVGRGKDIVQGLA